MEDKLCHVLDKAGVQNIPIHQERARGDKSKTKANL